MSPMTTASTAQSPSFRCSDILLVPAQTVQGSTAAGKCYAPSPMFILDAKEVATALPYDQMIDALAEAFASGAEVPLRAHYDIPVPDGTDGTLLLMPAWQSGRSIGVKIATVFPDNAKLDSPAVFASYFLMSAETGVPGAILDGTELTVRRTAAASALASRYLSRQDASCLHAVLIIHSPAEWMSPLDSRMVRKRAGAPPGDTRLPHG